MVDEKVLEELENICARCGKKLNGKDEIRTRKRDINREEVRENLDVLCNTCDEEFSDIKVSGIEEILVKIEENNKKMPMYQYLHYLKKEEFK